jgi:transposase-like protein
MRLRVRLPKIQPDKYVLPETCPYGCGGDSFGPHGVKGHKKAVRDIGYDEVVSYRYECLRCGQTFRVYPVGVSKGAQQSERLRAMTVLAYVLGMSYGAVEDFTVALGCGVSKTTVYNNVQAAGEVARRKQRERVAQGGQRPVIGADGTFVKVKGEIAGIEVVVDDRSGELLGLEIIISESYDEIVGVIQAVATTVDAEVLVTDDHGAYNEVVDDTGLAHQICRSHAKRNTDELADSLGKHLQRAEPLPEGVSLTPEQVSKDLEQLRRWIRERPSDGEQRLADMYDRYKAVPRPKNGERHSVWYRMRMMITRVWLRWRCLTLDQQRDDLDGTNNACERLIGWWIKERYRTMRGYKRCESIRNVATLTAHIGAAPDYYDLTELMA